MIRFNLSFSFSWFYLLDHQCDKISIYLLTFKIDLNIFLMEKVKKLGRVLEKLIKRWSIMNQAKKRNPTVINKYIYPTIVLFL
jgi:hypothetical protein